MGKIDNNKQMKRESLLDSAFSLFINNGFSKTSISDIVNNAGVAKGTFYLYFKDKYDIRNHQTVMGKAPAGVAKIAKEFQKPVLAFSGCVTEDAKACHAAGIDAFFPIVRGVISLEDAMQTDHAKQNMTDTVEQVFRMLRTFQNIK